MTFHFIPILFALSLITYAVSAAFVVLRRLRHDRRRRVLQQLEATLSGNPPVDGVTTREHRSSRAREDLGKLPIALIIRVADEPTASTAAREALAQSCVSRLGVDALCRMAETHAHPRRQIAAMRMLSFSGRDEAFGCIERAFAHGSRDVLAAAVVLLGRFPDLRAATLLIDALRRNIYARSRIATSLDAFPLDISHLVAPLLTSEDAQVRYWGVLLMRRFPRTEGLSRTLVLLTVDAQPSVRKAAIEAIGVGRYPGCVDAIQMRLADRVPYVRAHAARALGAMGARDAAWAVVPLLADREWLVRSAAKESLEAMGPEIALPVMHALSHRDAFARNGAAEVLQNLGLFEAYVARHASSGDDVDAPHALEVLATAAGPRMWNTVLTRLSDESAERARHLLASVDVQEPPDA